MHIVIIGPGRMGTALTLALQSLGHVVTAACGHGCGPDSTSSNSTTSSVVSASSARFESLTGVRVGDWKTCGSAISNADVILLTVPDKAVTVAAQTLADSKRLNDSQVVIHTSGSQSSSVLHPVKNTGAAVLSMHPLQTIADPAKGAKLFEGVYFTLEGDDMAKQVCLPWIEVWGGTALSIRPEQRPAYHAAAALASNAVVALASVAAQVSGLEQGLQALLPLMRGALDNLQRLGLPQALTGPVERGDLSTVKAHVQALQHNPTALCVYAALGKATADVARSKESLSLEQWESFQQLFTSVLGGM